jgi:hypothetical protein
LCFALDSAITKRTKDKEKKIGTRRSKRDWIRHFGILIILFPSFQAFTYRAIKRKGFDYGSTVSHAIITYVQGRTRGRTEGFFLLLLVYGIYIHIHMV